MKRKISQKALSKLHSFSDLLDNKYGKRGTPKRDKFDKEAIEHHNKNMKDENEDMQ